MRLFGLIIPMMLVVTALAEQKRILADPFDDREFYVSDDHFGSWMARCLAEVNRLLFFSSPTDTKH